MPFKRQNQGRGCLLYSKVPAAGFEPAHFGQENSPRLSVWPELAYRARSKQKLICI
jgi:hypothetical protein